MKETMATKKTKLPVTATKFSKSGLVGYLAEYTEFSRAEVSLVLEGLEQALLSSVRPGGAGEFTLPGLIKIKSRHVAAVKGGKKVPNPFKPGEMMVTKSKPATIKLKALPMAKVKAAANGQE